MGQGAKFHPVRSPLLLCFQVKNKVYPSKKKLLTGFKSIYGIPRGGLMVGVAISHRLGLPLKLKIEELDQETLVVDDITDSGRTLENLDKALNFKPMVATLFYHKNTCPAPNFDSCLRFHSTGEEHSKISPALSRRLTLGSQRNNRNFGDGACRMPDFYIREKKDWVVFPWETSQSSRYDN